MPFKDKAKSYAAVRAWIRKHPQRQRALLHSWYRRNWDRLKAERDALRLDCLSAYAPPPRPVCACCGERELAFLVIDHINGVPRNVPRPRGGNSLYRALRKLGYPPGYRVLCLNCNHVIGRRGRTDEPRRRQVCPHQRRSPDSTA